MRFRCLLLLIPALVASACTQELARDTATSSSAASEVTTPLTQLNALRRQARTLKTPLAEYAFYLDHYEHSRGAVRGFIVQVLAALEAELGAYEQAVRRYPQQPLLRGIPAARPNDENFDAVDAATAIAALTRERRIFCARATTAWIRCTSMLMSSSANDCMWIRRQRRTRVSPNRPRAAKLTA